MNGTQTGTSNPDLSGPGSNVNKEVFYTLPISWTRDLLSDAVMCLLCTKTRWPSFFVNMDLFIGFKWNSDCQSGSRVLVGHTLTSLNSSMYLSREYSQNILSLADRTDLQKEPYNW